MISVLPFLVCSQRKQVPDHLLFHSWQKGGDCDLVDEQLVCPKCWIAIMCFSPERASSHENIHPCDLAEVTKIVPSLLQSTENGDIVNQWSYSGIIGYSKDHSWLLLHLSGCLDAGPKSASISSRGVVQRLVRNITYLQIEQGPGVTWIKRSPNRVRNSKLKSLWKLSIYEALCTHKMNLNHLSSKLTVS